MVARTRAPVACQTVGVSTARDRRARLAAARLYFVADRAGLRRSLDGALAGGADLVQLRDKTAGDADLLAAAAWVRERCAAHGALFILNDRPDLATAAGADGVHVGQDDMPVAEARAIVGADAIVGLSTHSIAQADAGARSGADYIAVGPVHATPTKEGRPAIGLDPVRHAARHVTGLPWFAIGGLDEETIGAVAAAGARRAVIVRAIAHAPDPEAATRALRAALRGEPVEAVHGTP
ncbi:MAG: thiamine-phosphate pyrophosphorylase [Solirubrobacteraceae bacterium]|nr:thiamine-phosphate pyrophosphorylase [Solirubrobacteraceae bacterium]